MYPPQLSPKNTLAVIGLIQVKFRKILETGNCLYLCIFIKILFFLASWLNYANCRNASQIIF